MTDTDLSISEITFNKLLQEKNNSDYKNLSWDEWFQYLVKTKTQTIIPNMFEKTIRKFYERDFDEWVTNFAGNINHIWAEKSAKELELFFNDNSTAEEKSAIVIGRGPSIKKHKHLELLANSNYKGSIICTDGALINVLNAGVTPEIFPKFYVVTADPYKEQLQVYDNKIIDEFGAKIKGFFSTLTNPIAVERARRAGIQIHWYHPLFDYNEGKKSFNQISALMVRTIKHIDGLPAIQTGGNVGTSSWFVAWQILKCKTIGLIGINHGWEEDDPLDMILSHGHNSNLQQVERNSLKFKKLFPTIYNPDFKTNCILDPLFQYYRNALLEFISRSPVLITTINCTEGGSIFGDRIISITFKNFLTNYF